MSTFGKVAVLSGGSSSEREVSLMSGRGVLNALLSKGVDAYAFDPLERDVFQLRSDGAERCFIALHGRHGEDGTVQGALELMRIPYTGSGVLASSIAMDKAMTKRLWQGDGLATPRWRLVRSEKETEQAFDWLSGPMIVKPSREGSTIGLTKVINRNACGEAYRLASMHDQMVLCEQFVQGDEVTCPVLGVGDEAFALPVIKIVAPGGQYDYHNKYFGHETKYLVPSGLPGDEERAIEDMVVKAYRSIGCRGWARADIMIDADTRQPYLLEINTSPGMTSHSLVPMAAKASGLDYEDLCLRVLSMATLDGVCT